MPRPCGSPLNACMIAWPDTIMGASAKESELEIFMLMTGEGGRLRESSDYLNRKYACDAWDPLRPFSNCLYTPFESLRRADGSQGRIVCRTFTPKHRPCRESIQADRNNMGLFLAETQQWLVSGSVDELSAFEMTDVCRCMANARRKCKVCTGPIIRVCWSCLKSGNI
jgi:hypothetical protein